MSYFCEYKSENTEGLNMNNFFINAFKKSSYNCTIKSVQGSSWNVD